MEEHSTSVWKPLSFLLQRQTEAYNLIILNTPICIKEDIIISLWNNAASRVTVDGGTDEWLKWSENAKTVPANGGIPDVVTGDFDSIRPETLSMLKDKKSVQIVHTPDEMETDFTKAVMFLLKKSRLHPIVVISEISGRLDQLLAQVNTLFKCDAPIFLLSSHCATWLLKPGNHNIHVEHIIQNPLLLKDSSAVGLIPVGAPATVTTSGLKWNMENLQMKFGGLVSSSNTYNGEPVIKVSTDQPVLWTMSLSLGH